MKVTTPQLKNIYGLCVPPEPCAEKSRLMFEYQKYAGEYSVAVGNLSAQNLSEPEYEQWSAAAEAARQASHTAREAFDRHIAEYHC